MPNDVPNSPPIDALGRFLATLKGEVTTMLVSAKNGTPTFDTDDNLRIVEWPMLYKRAKTGAVQQWEISVVQIASGGASIGVSFGQVGGAIQNTSDVIKEGKNIGRSNATTALQQAISEAQSKWEKQISSFMCGLK